MGFSAFDRIGDQVAMTFDDVALLPAASNLTAQDISLKTKLSQNIILNMPFIAAMSITNVKMAIAMAQLGGAAIMPYNLSVSAQADQVSKIKKFQARIVRDVITVTPETSIIEVMEMQQRYDLSGLPVVEASTHVLAGFVTQDQLKDIDDITQPVGTIMTKEGLPTIASDVALDSAYDIMKQKNMGFVIVIDAQNRCVGLVTQSDKEKFEQYPQASVDEHGRLRAIAAIGTKEEDYDRVSALIDAGVDALYIDASHGHNKAVLDLVTYIRRQRTGHVDVIAGNAATNDAASALIDAGANAIRAGIGAGAQCSLKQNTGVYVPQITAIVAVADACQLQNIPVIADGGLRNSADIAKALAAGASTILSRALFADKNLSDVILELANHLNQAMCLTGCATLSAFRTQPRFIRIHKN